MSYIKHCKERKERKGQQEKLFTNFASFAVGAHGLPDMQPNFNIILTHSTLAGTQSGYRHLPRILKLWNVPG
jgi:hypothetical protein